LSCASRNPGRGAQGYIFHPTRTTSLTTDRLCIQDMANCIRCGRQLPPLTFKKICQWCVRHEAAQRGEEVDDRQPVITQPWVRRGESSITLTQIIFGVNIAVFLATALASGS